MNKFYQYAMVLLSNGSHNFQYNLFIACSENGLTNDEITNFLIDRHDVVEEANSEGLGDGLYWTYADTSAGVYPRNRDSTKSEIPIYCASPELIALYDLAPEMFYE